MANCIQTTGGILHSSDLEFITQCICDVFQCDPSQITELKPLQKGWTNSVLGFKYNGGYYVYRFPGTGSEILVDRGRESIVQKQIEDAGVDTTLVAMSVQHGWRISRFIENRPFDYHDINDMVRGIILLRKLHKITPKVRWEFDLKDKWESLRDMIPDNQYGENCTLFEEFNDIRDLFAQLPEAKIRGWKAGRFSFNAKGGRCEECMGNGYKTIQMHFMPDVYVPCEVCGGQRYNRETLEVRWKGKTIADILEMTVNQAVEFFEPQPKILRKIKTIQDVGLGYIKLGQSSTSLSGGESQRIKLATELSRPSTGKTLYILDEPTTGLHFEDIRVLLGVLRRLVEKGNTVLIIEHNTDVIRACNWIIDMGPEGGRGGGTVVAEGTVEDLRNNPQSITGKFI